MIINDPATLIEIEAAFAEYERALERVTATEETLGAATAGAGARDAAVAAFCALRVATSLCSACTCEVAPAAVVPLNLIAWMSTSSDSNDAKQIASFLPGVGSRSCAAGLAMRASSDSEKSSTLLRALSSLAMSLVDPVPPPGMTPEKRF